MTNQFNPTIDYAKTGDCNHSQPFYALRNDLHDVKVSKKLAKQILLFDITVARLGTVRNLQLKHIGLGIHEVRLLPVVYRKPGLLQVETSESVELRVGSNVLVTEFFE